MNLFDYEKDKFLEKKAPLASRMRPVTLDDFVGQEHIVGKKKMLYRAIQADRLSSVLFYGPPGTGKTTLAKIIANSTKSNFYQLNATISGIKDIKEIIEKAEQSIAVSGKRTILFIDEIHRFNKSQQDTLLPYVENGVITLVGATTENPYFEVNKALVSRSLVLELKYLAKHHIRCVLEKAIKDQEKGLGNHPIEIEEIALDFLADMSGGDARKALNALELAFLTTDPNEKEIIHIDLTTVEDSIQKRAIPYDKSGDSHYDTISAFIKSMRGSDPDACLYYLARMLAAGEDPKFIARRIVICASEDVGNADPQALTVAVSAFLATERVGLPESQIILAQAVLYIACAPKSNAACVGIFKALDTVAEKHMNTIPTHLKSTAYSDAHRLGSGIGYLYPHDYDNHYVKQQYLPDEVKKEQFYFPSENGFEKKIKIFLEKLKEEK